MLLSIVSLPKVHLTRRFYLIAFVSVCHILVINRPYLRLSRPLLLSLLAWVSCPRSQDLFYSVTEHPSKPTTHQLHVDSYTLKISISDIAYLRDHKGITIKAASSVPYPKQLPCSRDPGYPSRKTKPFPASQKGTLQKSSYHS